MAASKNNFDRFKITVSSFVKKRTEVVIKINKISRTMSANDRNLYKYTEQFKLRIKDAELKARNHCVKLQ